MEDEKNSKYKGVRRRKWGKWVSEIRVPGSRERLWLGSYATAEAAAVAHDIAFYCLRKPSSSDSLNFPSMVFPASVNECLSPRSVQKAASDGGLAVDAQMILKEEKTKTRNGDVSGSESGIGPGTHKKEQLSISVDDYLF